MKFLFLSLFAVAWGALIIYIPPTKIYASGFLSSRTQVIQLCTKEKVCENKTFTVLSNLLLELHDISTPSNWTDIVLLTNDAILTTNVFPNTG